MPPAPPAPSADPARPSSAGRWRRLGWSVLAAVLVAYGLRRLGVGLVGVTDEATRWSREGSGFVTCGVMTLVGGACFAWLAAGGPTRRQRP